MSDPKRIIPIHVSKAEALEPSLFEVHRKVYPRALHGWFNAWRWALVALTQIIFYGLPWLPWNDRQAVLFDLAARKFHIFGLIFWPQDFIYLTALLVISALGLFLFTAVAGRVWCGYACPQTVYTEIFLWIERQIEGERQQRIKLDNRPLDLDKFLRKAAKHFVWIALSLWTGITFVGYFSPIQTLVPHLWNFTIGPWEAFWILFYGFATYGNAGWMREQVCKYMCPYARFQSAMFDPDTLVITYDAARGEPRGPRAKASDPASLGLGSCVDCGVCVQVCPTGIDIREGLQYECIGCAACIDGCNMIMDKMGYAPGLIRYTTENALSKGWSNSQMWRRALRPRVLIYTGILLAIVIAVGASLTMRVPLKVDVMRDRGAMGREVEDGWIENVYRLQIMNQAEEARSFTVSADGIDGIIAIAPTPIVMEAATTRSVAIALRIPPGKEESGSHKIKVKVEATDDPEVTVKEKAVFLVPRP